MKSLKRFQNNELDFQKLNSIYGGATGNDTEKTIRTETDQGDCGDWSIEIFDDNGKYKGGSCNYYECPKEPNLPVAGMSGPSPTWPPFWP